MKSKPIAGAAIGLLSLVGHSGAETVGHEKYTYDASGNIVEKQIDDQVTRFEYEGNLLKADSTGTAYRHDRAGRLTGESLAGQVRRELTYRFGDKVTRVERGGTRTELFYNAEGQLVGRASGKQVETLIWDGLALVGRGGEGFVTEEHPSGGSAVIAHGKVVAFDYLGTTLSVGEDVFDSTAFGEGLENGLLTGKPFIEDLDSFIFRFRQYRVEGPRWNVADPSGFPDGPNNYAYVGGDPVSKIDPLGLETEYVLHDFVYQAQAFENADGTGDPINIGDPMTLAYKFKVEYTCSETVTYFPNTAGWNGAPDGGDVANAPNYTWSKSGNPVVTSLQSGEKDEVEGEDYTYIYNDVQWDVQFNATTTNTSQNWSWSWAPDEFISGASTNEFVCEN